MRQTAKCEFSCCAKGLDWPHATLSTVSAFAKYLVHAQINGKALDQRIVLGCSHSCCVGTHFGDMLWYVCLPYACLSAFWGKHFAHIYQSAQVLQCHHSTGPRSLLSSLMHSQMHVLTSYLTDLT